VVSKPKLLVISHVLPFPGNAGQQQRVRYTLEAAVPHFEVDFLTYSPREKIHEVFDQFANLDCRPIVLEGCVRRTRLQTLRYHVTAGWYVLRTGLKSSNYCIGELELSPVRIRQAVNPEDYHLVLYEYFHAVNSVPLFQAAGVPTVLDTHNVLWKALEQQISRKHISFGWLRRAWVSRYRRQEEAAWRKFDGVIAINRSEQKTIQAQLRPSQRLFYGPMGAELSRWPYSWLPAKPPRVAYYGGLGSPHNEAAALRCHQKIMPLIWQRFPEAELWLVGSNPSDRLRQLTADSRVKVTGFVDKVQNVLSTMSLVLCPWSGTYGFRSRIVEVMALGVPVVATPEAVDGMELESGRGIALARSNHTLAEAALKLLDNPHALAHQSHMARSEMERLYSLENTYGRLTSEFHDWLQERQKAEVSSAR